MRFINLKKVPYSLAAAWCIQYIPGPCDVALHHVFVVGLKSCELFIRVFLSLHDHQLSLPSSCLRCFVVVLWTCKWEHILHTNSNESSSMKHDTCKLDAPNSTEHTTAEEEKKSFIHKFLMWFFSSQLRSFSLRDWASTHNSFQVRPRFVYEKREVSVRRRKTSAYIHSDFGAFALVQLPRCGSTASWFFYEWNTPIGNIKIFNFQLLGNISVRHLMGSCLVSLFFCEWIWLLLPPTSTKDVKRLTSPGPERWNIFLRSDPRFIKIETHAIL